MQIIKVIKVRCSIKILLLGGAFLLLPAISQAAEVRDHYKCFVQLQDESKRVAGFVTEQETKAKFVEQLLGEKVFNPDGETGSNIIHIYECVSEDSQFTIQEATTLEAQNPR